MADVMDLDMSLDEIAKKRAATHGNAKGRGRRVGVVAEASGKAASSLKHAPARASPYSRDHGGAPEGKWGHGGFMQQNNIKGGDLAARLAANRPTGGVDHVPDNEAAPRRQRKTIASNELMSRALADATGGSQPSKGRGAISVKGASGATVEVRNLVQGTTAEDVQAIFSDSGPITFASEIPSRIKGAVAVQLRFQNISDAEKARKTFDAQIADGRKLEVVVLSGGLLTNALGGAVSQNSGFDLLPESPSGGAGMRSDALLSDPRAHVMTTPNIVGAAKQRGR